jgi:hypothetical protein
MALRPLKMVAFATPQLLFPGEEAGNMTQQPEIASKPIITMTLSPTIDLLPVE